MTNLNTTIVIISYNRAELIRAAHNSVRAFYPELPVIIVDGSDVQNECWEEVEKIARHDRTHLIRAGRNIGHGRGMDRGIAACKTKYVLVMDSDAEIKHGGVIETMLAALHDRAFGAGQVVYVNDAGANVPPNDPDAIRYLHPYFALINREIYNNVPGFVHHGAPCIRTMIHLKAFKKYELIDFPVQNFVRHSGRGTRSIQPKEFLQGWE